MKTISPGPSVALQKTSIEQTLAQPPSNTHPYAPRQGEIYVESNLVGGQGMERRREGVWVAELLFPDQSRGPLELCHLVSGVYHLCLTPRPLALVQPWSTLLWGN